MVFNAASKFKGASLNDHLMTGPNLLNSSTGILMRFREERVAISADIESMFSHVVVPKDDQTVLRFLWREDRNSPPEVYQYCRHIFGAKSSPTSVNYALHRTAKDNSSEFPLAAEAIMRNFYMDDLFKSEKDKEIAVDMCLQDLSNLLSKDCFRLARWCSDSREVLSNIPESELAPCPKSLDLDGKLPIERALGAFETRRRTRLSSLAACQGQLLPGDKS